MFCGVSGLKPTYGRVPNAGCVPLGFSLDHIGPIARTAEDCRIVLRAIEGPDPRDDVAVVLPELTRRAGERLSVVRIGVERAHHIGAIDDDDPSAGPAFEASLQTLAELGATLVDVTLPMFSEAVTASVVCAMSEAFAYHRPYLRSRPELYAASNRAVLPLGACFSGADYVQAQRIRRAAQRSLADLFADVDVIAMPGATRVAPNLDDVLRSPIFEMLHGVFTQYWDAVGNPALVVPMGFNDTGLPFGLQLAGQPFEDDLVLDVGAAFQHVTDWHLRVPAAGSADIA
jgi:aspartyl-tRNA(Asn)/glutamyl-tRNA(Gln) amidotransferase subunit A